MRGSRAGSMPDGGDGARAPGALRLVEKPGAGGIGGVGRALAGQMQADHVLRQQQGAGAGECGRLVPRQPQQLRRGEAGERRHAERGGQFRAEAFQRIGLGVRAAVVPQHRRAHRPVRRVEQHRRVHLPGQPDRRDLGDRRRCLGLQARERRFHRRPPRIRVLLRRERRGVGGGERNLGAGPHCLPRIDDQRLDGRGAEIDAEEAGHVRRVSRWFAREPAQVGHALVEHLVAVARDRAPDAQRGGDLRRQGDEAFDHEVAGEAGFGQRGEHVFPVDRAAARHAAVALGEMDVGRAAGGEAQARCRCPSPRCSCGRCRDAPPCSQRRCGRAGRASAPRCSADASRSGCTAPAQASCQARPPGAPPAAAPRRSPRIPPRWARRPICSRAPNR